MTPGPVEIAGTWVWRAAAPGLAVLFTGRGAAGTLDEVFQRAAGAPRPVASASQVHSARVLAARPGNCGEGDALVQGRSAAAALAIVTADCVPILLATPEEIAAVHAGWRGIAQGIVAATLAALAAAPDAIQAWIGPAIGPCCYETGQDVADQVVAASSPAIATLGAARGPGITGTRPHLDLQAAVAHQLRSGGVLAHRIQTFACCTRCHPLYLHSYRREGKGSGRNCAFIAVSAP
jgi:YfiH family protein